MALLRGYGAAPRPARHASRRRGPAVAAMMVAALAIAACATIPIGEERELYGRTIVQWIGEDDFVYRKLGSEPLTFKASFLATPIVPDDMYTDGGSVPRIFWNVPGLSPWGLGPAYIMHDWVFITHRCQWPDVPEEIRRITFEQSARILAEVGASLVDAGLIENDRLAEVVWAVRTRYARALWDTPGSAEDCRRPPPLPPTIAALGAPAVPNVVVDFTIPDAGRRNAPGRR